jgi:hypothetical protein
MGWFDEIERAFGQQCGLILHQGPTSNGQLHASMLSTGIPAAAAVVAPSYPHDASKSFQLALVACNAYNVCMQYTLRNVPGTLDEALRRAAREQGKSLNEVAIEALARGAGVTGERSRQRDLNDIAGTWRKDPAFDSALAAQDTIDEEMWR